MSHSVKRLFPLALALLLVSTLAWTSLPPTVQAQDSQRYKNLALGVTFDLPAGWQVNVENNILLAGTATDLVEIENGGAPQGLTLRMIFGTFNELGITDATQIPNQLTKLIPSGVTPPQPTPAQWGNGSGHEILVQLPEGLTTRVALLAIAGGRVAIVRGLAPTAAWDASEGANFQALADSFTFTLPQRDAGYLADIPSNDGGVLWHFVAPPPESGRVVQAGGLVYDTFDIMYVAAGPGGVMALELETGNRINFIGPWYDGNFVDLAIGPDTKLYLANTDPDTSNAVMVADRAGNWLRGWGPRGDGDGQFAPDMPRTIAVSSEGYVWTVSEGHTSGIRNRLYKFDSVGNLLLTVDLDTVNPSLSGIRIDNNVQTGGLYLTGATGNVNVIDANGQPLVVNLAQEVLQGTTPVDIAIAPNANIILAMASPGLDGFGFAELSVAGKLLDVFGFPLEDDRVFLPGEYRLPGGLVVGLDGTSYWAETDLATGYTQVQRFTFSGDGRLALRRPSEESDTPAVVAVDAPDPANGGGTLAYGQSVTGSLNNRYPSHNWTFEGTAGDHVIITMIDPTGAGLLDPQIVLKNNEGRDIAANDDVGAVRPEGMAERDARLEYWLSASGVFTIEAGRFGGRGEYVLTLEKVAE